MNHNITPERHPIKVFDGVPRVLLDGEPFGYLTDHGNKLFQMGMLTDGEHLIRHEGNYSTFPEKSKYLETGRRIVVSGTRGIPAEIQQMFADPFYGIEGTIVSIEPGKPESPGDAWGWKDVLVLNVNRTIRRAMEADNVDGPVVSVVQKEPLTIRVLRECQWHVPLDEIRHVYEVQCPCCETMV